MCYMCVINADQLTNCTSWPRLWWWWRSWQLWRRCRGRRAGGLWWNPPASNPLSSDWRSAAAPPWGGWPEGPGRGSATLPQPRCLTLVSPPPWKASRWLSWALTRRSDSCLVGEDEQGEVNPTTHSWSAECFHQAELVPEPSFCLFFRGIQTRKPRNCSTNTRIQRGAGENSLELLRRLVMKMVSSRLATIRARQSEKKTSGSKRRDRQAVYWEERPATDWMKFHNLIWDLIWEPKRQ